MTGNAGAGKKVLVIDDSEVALALAEEALSQAGFDVLSVQFPTKSEPLMRIVANFKPDLILADVEMPLLKGDDFVRIAKKSPALQNLKVYFYSSASAERLAAITAETAADGYIHKTDDLTAVVDRVREILRS